MTSTDLRISSESPFTTGTQRLHFCKVKDNAQSTGSLSVPWLTLPRPTPANIIQVYVCQPFPSLRAPRRLHTQRGGNGIHPPPCVIPTSMNVQRSRHYSLNDRLCILSVQDIVGLRTETDAPSYHSYGQRKLKYSTTNVYTVQNQCSFYHMYHQSIISQQTRSECKITGTGGRESSRQDTHKI